jgi:peptide chain release factor 1
MDLKITRDIEERRSSRRKLVGTMDRSEKIRTYNYAQVILKKLLLELLTPF